VKLSRRLNEVKEIFSGDDESTYMADRPKDFTAQEHMICDHSVHTIHSFPEAMTQLPSV
jgi:hypothetical protein